MTQVTPTVITKQSRIFHAIVGQVEGRILTIVEASYQDIEQREAVKSLVRNAIWDWARKTDRVVFPSSKYDQDIDQTKSSGQSNN